MFTVKMSQILKHPENGEANGRVATIYEAHSVQIKHLRGGELVGLDLLDQQGEYVRGFYLTKDGAPAAGIPDLPYYQAIIENASGRTTEIIRL